MITMMMQGGLGNQMFQYAAGYAMAKKLGVELALNVSSYEYDSQRRYNLNLFALPEHKITFDRNTVSIVEPSIAYQPLMVRDGDVISGYFQCEDYFQEYRKELSQIFVSRAPDPGSYYRYFNALTRGSVAVTVRRGDYLQKQDFHGVLPMDYYYRALNYILNNQNFYFDPLNVFVFSDDIEWCKKNFIQSSQFWKMTFVENDMTTRNYTGREDTDIALMSMCRYHILANSTFSWWGAWLSGSKNVIAPKDWFTDQSYNKLNNIVPERWTKL